MNIPYLFKYKPKTLNDFHLSNDIQSIIQLFINNNYLLLLLVGESGTGKTALIECILDTYYANVNNDNKNNNTLIQIDGGVSLNNAQELISLGADVLVAGSFVFKSDSPKETIEKLHSAIN